MLTNGTLLSRKEVREALSPADVVLPTLSSVFEGTWKRIHRPAPGISLDEIISGIRQFHEEYAGEVWVELFIIPGVNTDDRELAALSALLRELHPDRVQLEHPGPPGDRRVGQACIRRRTRTYQYIPQSLRGRLRGTGPVSPLRERLP